MFSLLKINILMADKYVMGFVHVISRTGYGPGLSQGRLLALFEGNCRQKIKSRTLATFRIKTILIVI